jgi:dihydroorotase
MRLKDLERLELPASADMHVHLRQGELMSVVVPQIRMGGVDTVFVMVGLPTHRGTAHETDSYSYIQPNLQPPVTTVARALEYKSQLEAIDPNVTYLMSLYLHISTPASTVVFVFREFSNMNSTRL